MTTPAVEDVHQHSELKRSITGKQLYFYVVGDVLGSGIYVLVGLVAAAVGGAFWMAFLAGVAIAQQFGRPHTPEDQAWIETLFGHVKGEWPHLEKIVDPGDLEAELEHVRQQYNGVRLHASIGYVTPDDEHEGRGDAIRKARRDGLDRARQQRLDHHRASRGQ